MAITSIVFVLIVIGVGMFLLNKYVPMNDPIKTIINVVVVLAVLFWLMNAFGFMTTGHLFHCR